MRTLIAFLLISATHSTFAQNYSVMLEDISSDNRKKALEYLDKIDPKDTLCANELRKAMIKAEDSLYFIVWNRAFGQGLRYETELMTIVQERGLKFSYEFTSDIYFENQTFGCFKAYMDKKIAEKYGAGFKTKLYNQADSMFLANHINDAIIAWDCDVEPMLIGKKYFPDINIETKLPITLGKERLKLADGSSYSLGNPFMDILFVIDKQGHVSDFRVVDFVPGDVNNLHLEKKLFKLAEKELKTHYQKWTPATIRGEKVKSKYVARVGFKQK